MTGLERLNFTNGRLLDAADLRVEQHYHIAIRRMLNRGLFTPGVVNGLEVAKKDTRTVTVSSGLALDPDGRELFVADPVDVAVPNQLPLNKDRSGYFLALRYEEADLPGAAHPCDAGGTAPEPARIREEPRLEWTEDWPDHAQCGRSTGRPLDCSIVIALLTLDASCQIAGIETAFRQYAYPSHLSQVQAIGLEGEKDIDAANPKVLRFQVRGGNPSSVLLYLWGGRFSSLYYTELGLHTHALTALALGSVSVDLGAHTHGLGGHTHTIDHTHQLSWNGLTDPAGEHRHPLKVEPNHGYRVGTTSGEGSPPYIESPHGSIPYVDLRGDHQHDIHVDGPTGAPSAGASGGPSSDTSTAPSPNSSVTAHTHPLSSATLSTVGNGDAVREGTRLGWLENLRVALDGVDVTQQLLDRFLSGWGQLGDGLQGHPLNATGGTGPLNLLALGRRIDQGPHELELRVPSGGGKILYNLYLS